MNKICKKYRCRPARFITVKGEVLHHVMKQGRITMDDLYAALHRKNIADLKDVDAIVSETAGDITIICNMQLDSETTLGDVKKLSAGELA